ncbi:MAG: hypothetical protein KC621_15880 [Myxococcales bacterium]|nr:hypothetical protein [Myxococcales bacterium]
MTRSLMLLPLLAACGVHEAAPESLAAAGRPVVVTVESRDDGSLHAQELSVARTHQTKDDEKDVNVPIEDLPQAVVDAALDRYPGATLLEGEVEDGEYGVELVTTDDRHLEVEFDRDGTFLEEEPADANDDDDAIVHRAFVEGEPNPESRVLGIALTTAEALPQGPVRVTGTYRGSDAFDGASVSPATGQGLRLGGVSQGVEDVGDGFVVTVMDRAVLVDDATRVNVVEDPLDDE